MITIIAIGLAWLFGAPWLSVVLALPALFLIDTAHLWALYLAVMNLVDVRDDGKLPADAELSAKLVGAYGLFVDVVYNLTWANAIFFDIPREFTVTARIERYVFKDVSGRRADLGRWFARVMLDPYARGGHIKP